MWGLSLWPCGLSAQQMAISLDECYAWARENYPLIRKLDLIGKSSAYSLANAGKLYLPQLGINGQASYQSETVNFSNVMGSFLPEGTPLPQLSKDQYRLQAEVSQNIYDAGAVSNQRAYIKANDSLQRQGLEVSFHVVKERIDQLFFAIIMLEEQLKQNEIRKGNIESGKQKMDAALKYGTAFRSNVDELKAELVNVEMASIELDANRKAYMQMLGLLVGKEWDKETVLVMPDMPAGAHEINRPEVKLYQLQKSLLDVEEKKLRGEYLPRISAFFQGAYGRPTLNIISNDFGSWYVGGLRLTWNLGSLYTLKNTRNNLDISRKNIDADLETFVLNTKMQLKQQDSDIAKYHLLLQRDEEAIALRESVRKAALAQLENGVATTHDYISQLNAEHLARQTRILHTVQLLQAQYKQQNISGNH